MNNWKSFWCLKRFTSQLNGYTALCLTKTDILDKLDEVKIGVAYVKVTSRTNGSEDDGFIPFLLYFQDGKKLDHYPSGIFQFDGVSVEYLTMPGWKTSIADCRSFDELPVNCKNYILKAQELLGEEKRQSTTSKLTFFLRTSFQVGWGWTFPRRHDFETWYLKRLSTNHLGPFNPTLGIETLITEDMLCREKQTYGSAIEIGTIGNTDLIWAILDQDKRSNCYQMQI